MENLIIKGDSNHPSVKFDAAKGIMELGGNSVPDKLSETYDPIFEWLNNYIEKPCKKTTFNFKLEYYNSTSQPYILEILKIIKKLHNSGKHIEINWYYLQEDEDLQEDGIRYQEIIDMPMNIVEITN